MLKGSQGQQVISPLIAEAQAQTSLLDELLKSLGIPDSDEDTAAKAEQRQRQARKAAQTRWGIGHDSSERLKAEGSLRLMLRFRFRWRPILCHLRS